MRRIWKEPFEPHRATPEEIARIEETAAGILAARQPFIDAGWSLARLYGPQTMPNELHAAHAANDKAVDAAYGIHQKLTDAERVAFLFRMYRYYTDKGCAATENA